MVTHFPFKILSMLNNREIGRQLEHLSFESFLYFGVTLLVFKIVGKEPHEKERLNKTAN